MAQFSEPNTVYGSLYGIPVYRVPLPTAACVHVPGEPPGDPTLGDGAGAVDSYGIHEPRGWVGGGSSQGERAWRPVVEGASAASQWRGEKQSADGLGLPGLLVDGRARSGSVQVERQHRCVMPLHS